MPHIPVHPSAEKRHRQSVKRQARNRIIKTRYRTVTKNALEAGQQLSAARNEIIALKGALAGLQNSVQQLQAAQKPVGEKKPESK